MYPLVLNIEKELEMHGSLRLLELSLAGYKSKSLSVKFSLL